MQTLSRPAPVATAPPREHVTVSQLFRESPMAKRLSLTVSLFGFWLLCLPLRWLLSAGSQPPSTSASLRRGQDVVWQLGTASLTWLLLGGLIAMALKLACRHDRIDSLVERVRRLAPLLHLVFAALALVLVVGLIRGAWGNLFVLAALGIVWWHWHTGLSSSPTGTVPFAREGVSRSRTTRARSSSMSDLYEGLLVGLAVRTQLDTLIRAGRQRASEQEERIALIEHLVLEGEEGTGKTSAAAVIARLYTELGALTDCGIEGVDRAGVESGLLNLSAADFVAEAMADASGRVLLLIEPPAREDFLDALEARMAWLVAQQRNDQESLLVVLAGSHRALATVWQARPSLRRFFRRHLVLPPLDVDDLTRAFMGCARRNGRDVSPAAETLLRETFREMTRRMPTGWAHGHEAERLYALAVDARAERLACNVAEVGVITGSDITAASGAYRDSQRSELQAQGASLPFVGESLERLLERLKGMTGLAGVKLRVEEEAALQAFMRSRGGEPTSPHLRFEGNPGTGKTTVAALVAAIYREHGLLTRGHFTVATRQDMVGEYQGHTAMKTRALLDRARGGVLLIDEAYALKQGDGDSFGQEAVDEIVGYIERPDVRDDLVVVLAGYTQEMERFVRTNAGLASRFPGRIEFEDYAPAELAAIFRAMLEESGLTLSAAAEQLLLPSLERFHARRDHATWANAREMRNLRDDLLRIMAVRLARGHGTEEATVTDLSDALKAWAARR